MLVGRHTHHSTASIPGAKALVRTVAPLPSSPPSPPSCIYECSLLFSAAVSTRRPSITILHASFCLVVRTPSAKHHISLRKRDRWEYASRTKRKEKGCSLSLFCLSIMTRIPPLPSTRTYIGVRRICAGYPSPSLRSTQKTAYAYCRSPARVHFSL